MNWNRLLTGVAALILVAGAGAAADTNTDFGADDIDESTLESAADTYNEQYASQVPGIVASVISDERVNVYVETADGEIVYGAVLDGVNISRIAEGGVENETLRVYTSTETIEAIVTAENPRKRAVTAFTSDEIQYEAVGFVRTLKLGIASFFITLLG